MAEENLPGRVAVMGGLTGLGLLAGRGKVRLVWATAGAGAGAALCYPHTVQALYNGESPALKLSRSEPCLAGELPQPSLPSVNFSDLVLKSGKYLDSIISSVRQVGQESQDSLEEDKLKITRESSLVFVRSSELQPGSVTFKGDQGMSREEDKDLYATRG